MPDRRPLSAPDASAPARPARVKMRARRGSRAGADDAATLPGLEAEGAAGAAENDREVIGMARGGGLNLVGAVISQLSLLGVTVVLVRQLGRADVGLYAQAFAFLVLLGLLSLSGFRAGLTRFVAVHLVDDDLDAVRGTVRIGVTISTVGALALGATLYAIAPWLVETAFRDDRLVMPLRYVAFALPVATFTDAALSATQGFRTMRPFAFVGLIFEPLVRLGLTVALVGAGFGLEGAMTALVLSNLAGAVAAGVALRRLLGRGADRPRYLVRELLGFSMVSWLASLASSGLVWADTILLGIFLPSGQVGIYNVSTRLVMLATFVAAPISASFAPRIANLYHRGRTESLARTYGVATSWIVRLALPAFVALLAFPHDLLRLFGPAYVVGASVTVVLAIGKLVDSATGPCGVMLNQSGRPGLSAIDNVGALVLNIGLNLWLIPTHGILGSAVAWAISLTLVNVLRVFQVWAIMGMLPFDTGVLKGLAAGAGALAVGLLVRNFTAPPWELLTGVLALSGSYLLLVGALGLSSEDRLVVKMLAGRAGLGRVPRRA